MAQGLAVCLWCNPHCGWQRSCCLWTLHWCYSACRGLFAKLGQILEMCWSSSCNIHDMTFQTPDMLSNWLTQLITDLLYCELKAPRKKKKRWSELETAQDCVTKVIKQMRQLKQWNVIFIIDRWDVEILSSFTGGNLKQGRFMQLHVIFCYNAMEFIHFKMWPKGLVNAMMLVLINNKLYHYYYLM